MIKIGFIQKQIEKYKRDSKVPRALAQIFFHVLATAVEKHYGSPRGDKCLQYSVGIKHLLERYGIQSNILNVEVRAIESKIDFLGNYRIGGFEGNNHHIICFSVFDEIIDFSIHFLHLHPLTSNPSNVINPPAMWWGREDPKVLEPAISYRPVGKTEISLHPNDQRDLEAFIANVDSIFEDTLKNHSVQTLPKRPILYDLESYIELAKSEENPWVNEALILLCKP